MNSPQAPKRSSSSVPIIGLILLVVIGFGVLLFLITAGATWVPSNNGAGATQASGDPLVTKVAQAPTPTAPSITSDDFVLGNPSGTVTIFLFSDFSCPYCATMSSELEQAVTTNPDLRVVWKDFPLVTIHPNALAQHVAARCAGAQGKFWQYHDELFANQTATSNDDLLTMAQQLNLKTENFSACLDSPATLRPIEANIALGNALGIDGTPYLFVGDQTFSGLVNAEELQQMIDLARTIQQKQK